MKVSFELKGTKELSARLKRLGPEAVQAAAASLYQSAEAVMTKSKEICPVQTGALRASGQVGMPEVTGNNVLVELGYGNASVDYAVHVHENLQAFHKPPTQAKFLEQPLKESLKDIEDKLKEDLDRSFQS